MDDIDIPMGPDRPVSPLYEAIRDIMAGTWPEDEYDVAESPLSYTEYKSQVSLHGEVEPVPVAAVGREGRERNSTSTGTGTGTDFESLKSDESSEWGEDDEHQEDDTMSTDIAEMESRGTKGDSAAAAAAVAAARERRRSLVEEPAAVAAPGIPTASIDAVMEEEDEVKIRPRRNTIADEFAEGFRAEIAQELSNLVQEEEEEEVVQPAAGIEAGGSILPPVAEHAVLTADTPEFSEKHLPRLTIPLANSAAAPIPSSEPTPPPIPSRSPSRPNTALAGYTMYPAPSASTTSLHPLKPTVSALSSPRSSRFFEDLATTTATSMEMKREGGDQAGGEKMEEKEKGKEKEKEKEKVAKVPVQTEEKKRRSSFSCGLWLWGRGKAKKAAAADDNARPATASVSSIAKR